MDIADLDFCQGCQSFSSYLVGFPESLTSPSSWITSEWHNHWIPPAIALLRYILGSTPSLVCMTNLLRIASGAHMLIQMHPPMKTHPKHTTNTHIAISKLAMILVESRSYIFPEICWMFELRCNEGANSLKWKEKRRATSSHVTGRSFIEAEVQEKFSGVVIRRASQPKLELEFYRKHHHSRHIFDFRFLCSEACV